MEKKKLYEKWWFWTILAVVFVVIWVSGALMLTNKAREAREIKANNGITAHEYNDNRTTSGSENLYSYSQIDELDDEDEESETSKEESKSESKPESKKEKKSESKSKELKKVEKSLKELNEKFDDLIDEAQGYVDNPKTYTSRASVSLLFDYTEILSDMAIIAEDVEECELELNDQDYYDIYMEILRKETELIAVMSDLPDVN